MSNYQNCHKNTENNLFKENYWCKGYGDDNVAQR